MPDSRSELLIAITYERLNQDKQAERYLDMAKHRAPNNPEVVRALAGFYREMGNYSAAITALKSLPNKSPEVKAELGIHLSTGRQTRRSREALRRGRQRRAA